jgi:hypothetical protein
MDEGDVGWDGERPSAMPARTVEDQDRMHVLRQAGGELGQAWERRSRGLIVVVAASGRTRARSAPVAGSTAAKR